MKYQIFAEIQGREWPLAGCVYHECDLFAAIKRISRSTGIDTDFLVAHPVKASGMIGSRLGKARALGIAVWTDEEFVRVCE